jgi:hypothetical protein
MSRRRIGINSELVRGCRDPWYEDRLVDKFSGRNRLSFIQHNITEIEQHMEKRLPGVRELFAELDDETAVVASEILDEARFDTRPRLPFVT